jgi:chorismate synthase
MSNSMGKEFVITCFGESHGKCIGVVIDGCPAGLKLSEKDIQKELEKRRPGTSLLVSQRKEKDKVEILSGVFNGYTTGAPICMIVRNKVFKSEIYEIFKKKPRPGHADYVSQIKYGGFVDYRGGGIFSGRITVAFVMAGAVAKKLLALKGIEVLAHVIEIGGIGVQSKLPIKKIRKIYESPVRCADPIVSKKMEEIILKAKREGDSVGGIIECLVLNLPIGIGDPIFDSLDSELSKAYFNIPAVKGVEFGAGFNAAHLRGSEYNDAFIIRKGRVMTSTNRAGGIVGGISTGMPIVARIAFKPTPSISKPQQTVNLELKREETIEVKGDFDPCIAIRAVPVVEAMTSIVLVDHLLREQFLPKVLK